MEKKNKKNQKKVKKSVDKAEIPCYIKRALDGEHFRSQEKNKKSS